MNGRALAIASGLLVTATSTALVGSATAAAIGGSEPARPAGGRSHLARSGQAAPSGSRSSVDPVLAAHNADVARDRVERAQFEVALNTLNAQLMIDAAAAAQRTRAATRVHSSSGYSGDILECIKHRESRGQYDVVNSSSGAAGAYQFMPGTWDNTARAAGRTDLVGVNPSNASPADQDAMAQHLLATQGMRPWGGSCG